MEMLLKTGTIKRELSLISEKNDKEFLRSLNNVINLIDGYEIKKSSLNNNQDIYYLYYFSMDYNEIDNSIKKIASGNYEDIVNIDSINDLINNQEQNVYWDVINNLIIVLGKDNLRNLLVELEKKRWECIKINNELFMKQYMDLCASNVYKKVMKSA